MSSTSANFFKSNNSRSVLIQEMQIAENFHGLNLYFNFHYVIFWNWFVWEAICGPLGSLFLCSLCTVALWKTLRKKGMGPSIFNLIDALFQDQTSFLAPVWLFRKSMPLIQGNKSLQFRWFPILYFQQDLKKT